jgi:hypothetical protein
MLRTTALPRLLLGRLGAGARGLLLALTSLAAALCLVQSAGAATQPGLVVVPRPSSRQGLSYFKLGVHPGETVRAGAVELRNLGAVGLSVSLAAVNGQTLSTLGSGYAPPSAEPLRSTRWLRLGGRLVVLAPHHRALVPVWVQVPRNAAPGDYLSGVSMEALDQNAESTPRKGIGITSVDRYVIGVETSIAGPRHPLIRITGVEVQHEPAGLTFLLKASNLGNVILEHTFGRALVTYGRVTVAELGLGPGTFVTGTSIAYPVALVHHQPPPGSVYRVRAYLLYPGGSARVDTYTRVGTAAATAPQVRGGPPKRRPRGSSGPSVALVAGGGVLVGLLVLCGGLLLLGRRRRAGRSPARVLAVALEASRAGGEPVGVIAVTLRAGAPARAELAAIVRSRIRQADQLCRLADGGYLVVAPDTDGETAEALAGDLRRHLERLDGGAGGVAVAVLEVDGGTDAAELLERIGGTSGDAHVLTPSG